MTTKKDKANQEEQGVFVANVTPEPLPESLKVNDSRMINVYSSAYANGWGFPCLFSFGQEEDHE